MALPSTNLQPADYHTFPSSEGSSNLPATSPPNNDSPKPSDVRPKKHPENTQSEDRAEDLETTSLLDTGVEFKRIYGPKFLLFALWILAALTIICIMVAIHHWAGYLFLAPVLLFALYKCSSNKETYVFSPEDLKKMRLWSYKTGKMIIFPHYQKDLLIGAAGSTLVSCFGFTGIYVMKLKLWDENWGDGWAPDPDAGPSPRLALWLWFMILACLGLSFLTISIICLAIIHLLKLYREGFNRPQPAKGPPPVPTISDVPPHSVECALPFTVLSIGVACGETFGLHGSRPLMWTGIAAVIVSSVWFLQRLYRQASHSGRLQLCVDWATDVDHIPVDPYITKAVAYREKIQYKYIWSIMLFLLLIIPTAFIIEKYAEKNPQAITIIAVVYFVLLYLGLWVIWRRLPAPGEAEDEVIDSAL